MYFCCLKENLAVGRDNIPKTCIQKTDNFVFFQRYPGGFKQVTAAQLHLKDPKAVSHVATLFSSVQGEF